MGKDKGKAKHSDNSRHGVTAKETGQSQQSGQQELIALREKVCEALEGKRYEHSLGVEYTAAALAMRYGYDIHKAQVAGILHDCAKNLSNKKRLHICEKNQIPITAAERDNPFLLHAKVGSYLAKTEYNITDQEILDAISCHTTGRPGMTLLDKILYVADYIEPGRSQAPNLREVRGLAFEDLDACLFRILGDTLSYLHETGTQIDEVTQETYDYYKKMRGGADL